jgi:hypothetical protein
MSYCRWSDLNHTCDVYAYQAEDGFQIHLSSMRRMGPHPYVPWIEAINEEISTEELHHVYSKYLASISDAALVDNGLLDEPVSYSFLKIKDFYNQLLELKDQGFNFPDEVIEEVKYEMWDMERIP